MLLFDLIVTLFVNEPQNPFLFTVSVNMSLKMYSFYGKVKFFWELSASQSQPHALGVIASMGTSDIDQVSKIGKLGLIDGNLVIIATKFSFL